MLPVYALIGKDKLKTKVVLDRLNQRMEEFGDMSFNSSIFNGETTTGEEIIQSCMQVPFNSEKRYILVNYAHCLKKDDSDQLIKYLENPNESTVLALVFEKLAKNTRLYKAIDKLDKLSIINCDPPKKYLLAENLNSIARKHNGSIELPAAKRLIELVGDDTVKIDAEIQKMLISNGNKAITLNQVESQVKLSAEAKPWDFTNAFAARDINKALDIFSNMNNGSEYILLPQTCKIVKELICVKDLGAYANQSNIAKHLKTETWRVKNHIAWANKFSKDELVEILSKALECDKNIKSTSNSALVFETFVIEALATN